MNCDSCRKEIETTTFHKDAVVTRNAIDFYVDIVINGKFLTPRLCEDCFWRIVLNAEEARHHGTFVLEIR